MPKEKTEVRSVRVWLVFYLKRPMHMPADVLRKMRKKDFVAIHQFAGRLSREEALIEARKALHFYPEARVFKLRALFEDDYHPLKPATLAGEEDGFTQTTGEISQQMADLVIRHMYRPGVRNTATKRKAREQNMEDYDVRDVIINLLHLTASKGWDVDDMLERARRDFEQER